MVVVSIGNHVRIGSSDRAPDAADEFARDPALAQTGSCLLSFTTCIFGDSGEILGASGRPEWLRGLVSAMIRVCVANHGAA